MSHRVIKTGIVILLQLLTVKAAAQQPDRSFHAYLYNDTYEVYMNINFYDQNITIPGQELYGELPGYLGKKRNSFYWVVTKCDVESEQKASLQLINDFGSEDLKATLTRKNDSVYVLKQESGSTIKVPNKGKWQKLPKILELKRNQRRK